MKCIRGILSICWQDVLQTQKCIEYVHNIKPAMMSCVANASVQYTIGCQYHQCKYISKNDVTVATIDGIIKGTTSVVELAEIGRYNWYTMKIKLKKGTNGSEQ